MKNSLAYFRHPTDAHFDPRIRALRKEYGAEGVGNYWTLCELIAKADGALLDISRRVDLINVQVETGLDQTALEKYLEFLASEEIGLLIREDGKITTEDLRENYKFVESKRQRNRAYYFRKDSNSDNPQTSSVHAQDVRRTSGVNGSDGNKENKSKVNNKVNKSKVNLSDLPPEDGFKTSIQGKTDSKPKKESTLTPGQTEILSSFKNAATQYGITWNFPKEGASFRRLLSAFQGREEDFRGTVETFFELVRGEDSFWNRQPPTPSRLLSMLSQVEMIRRGKRRPEPIPEARPVKMGTCPVCGTETPEGAQLCGECWFALDDASKPDAVEDWKTCYSSKGAKP